MSITIKDIFIQKIELRITVKYKKRPESKKKNCLTVGIELISLTITFGQLHIDKKLVL